MKRLLCIVGSMDSGGAETFLMKVYRKLDKERYQMDFAVTSTGYYDDEIIKMGGKIFFITPKSKGLIKNFVSIKNIVNNNNYNYVLRTSQQSLSALELFAAQLGGAKVRVFRSSNSNTTSASKKEMLVHKIFSFMPLKFSNIRLAPSTEAAEFMFGKNCIENGKATLMHNAIDLSLFKFDENLRNKHRKEFNIEKDFVIGHVGRFSNQKNHVFLLKVFNELLKLEKNCKLVLVGKGELQNDIIDQIKKFNIEDKVIFAGVRSDVNELLSVFDVFVFPSFYEGMPNTVIEAQATGLPCIISDTITKEVQITDLVTFKSIKEDAKQWALEILSKKGKERKNVSNIYLEKGYDIEATVNQFKKIIFADNEEKL